MDESDAFCEKIRESNAVDRKNFVLYNRRIESCKEDNLFGGRIFAKRQGIRSKLTMIGVL